MSYPNESLCIDRAPGSAAPTKRARAHERRTGGCRCPSCGLIPVEGFDRWDQWQDLSVAWLYLDPLQGNAFGERRYCRGCAPRDQVLSLDCTRCGAGDGPVLHGDLVHEIAECGGIPAPVRAWLVAHGWVATADGLVCATCQLRAGDARVPHPD